eukprot:365573-Chlamydomonas_euryale.AAC.17
MNSLQGQQNADGDLAAIQACMQMRQDPCSPPTSLNPGNCWNKSESIAVVLDSGKFSTKRILFGGACMAGPGAAARTCNTTRYRVGQQQRHICL